MASLFLYNSTYFSARGSDSHMKGGGDARSLS